MAAEEKKLLKKKEGKKEEKGKKKKEKKKREERRVITGIGDIKTIDDWFSNNLCCLAGGSYSSSLSSLGAFACSLRL